MTDKEKHIDEIHQHILDGALIYKLTNQEIAALLTSVMRNILVQEHNAAQLNDMGIDVNKLNPETITLFQKIWTEEYMKSNEQI